MSEKKIIDTDIHSFKIMNGNFALCERPYRIIGFNSDGKEDVIQIREVSQINSNVTCVDCKQILRGERNVFSSIQRRLKGI